jgi:hypothetical protein
MRSALMMLLLTLWSTYSLTNVLCSSLRSWQSPSDREACRRVFLGLCRCRVEECADEWSEFHEFVVVGWFFEVPDDVGPVRDGAVAWRVG